MTAATRPRRGVAWLLVSLAALAGCAGGGQPLPEPAPLPEIAKQTIEVERVWRRGAGDGGASFQNGLVAAIDGRNVYTAHADGVVSALDLEKGERVWRIETDLALSAGPTVAEGRVFVGSRDGQLLALSAKDGSELWRRPVSSEMLSPPTVAEGTVLVRTLDGHLSAFEIADGARRWTVTHNVPTLTSRGTSSPVVAEGVVFAGLDNGKVVAYDVTTGERVWEQTVAAPTGRSELERIADIDAGLLIAQNELYAASIGGKTASLSRTSGRIRWRRDIASRSGLTFRGGEVFLSDLDGSVWSLERTSGAALWEQDVLAHRGLSAPAVHRGYVLVGDFEGYLHWLIPEDGTVVARAHPVGDAIVRAPIVIGDRILVLSAGGDVALLETSFVQDEE